MQPLNVMPNHIGGEICLGRKWCIEHEIGSGGFARVHLARSESGESAVIKLIPKAPGADREILFEDLDGVPNIVPVIDRGEWNDFWVLVMPKAEKSLREYLCENVEQLSADESVRVLSDVTQALAAIEGRVVHRDIKPDNILLFNGQWCLADFGISRYAEATTAPDTQKYAMTPRYAAPEQWRGERASSATDVYSLGIVAYELLAGQVPFVGPEVHDYRRQHLEETPESISGIPLKMQSLIDECIYKGPEARPRPRNLLARLGESLREASEGAGSLQRANAIAVSRQAEEARQESVARSEAMRRLELCRAADRSLARVIGLLHAQIMLNAPASEHSGPIPGWSWSLNEAKLSVEPSRMAEECPDGDTHGSPFEIVAYSSITLQIQPDSDGFEGRSHSLWYCDAQEAGVFRWYETAFMISAFIAKRGRIDPFALGPGREAYIALAPITAEFQVARPFEAIDQGDEIYFVERWLGWFGQAAQDLLHRPIHLPECDPSGTWRRAS
ncbi:MAG: serine/threonine-protein kinase [Anaerolineaceae bacterium]|nr:serine/threonine-protein kinase [Anaerolineaceae bacterium]